MASFAPVEESSAFLACVGKAGRNYFSSWEEGRGSWTSESININDVCTAGATYYQYSRSNANKQCSTAISRTG